MMPFDFWYIILLVIWAASWQNQQNACAPSEDSDQPGHPPSLIWVFAMRMKKAWVLSYPLSAQQRHWSDWADAQADLSLRWAHMQHCHFVGFFTRRLICTVSYLGSKLHSFCQSYTPGWLCITLRCFSTILSVLLYNVVTLSLRSVLVTIRFVLVSIWFDNIIAPIQYVL